MKLIKHDAWWLGRDGFEWDLWIRLEDGPDSWCYHAQYEIVEPMVELIANES